MENCSTQNSTQGAIDKYLSREFQIIIKVVAFLGLFYTMVLLPLEKMRSDIDYIKTNHLAHIEQNIVEIRQFQQQETDKDNQRDIDIQRILTILSEHEKTTQKTIP